MDKQRKKKRSTQTSELYANIGKSIVEFEHLCRAMQSAITFILQRQGLQNQHVTNILLAGLTASPLQSLLESLIGELVELNDNEKKIVKNIFSRIQKIIERRNNIAHSTWFIGYGSRATEDFSETSGFKLHKNKQGSKSKIFNYKAADFLDFSKEAKKLSGLIGKLDGCINLEFSIENHFEINEAGNVIDIER